MPCKVLLYIKSLIKPNWNNGIIIKQYKASDYCGFRYDIIASDGNLYKGCHEKFVKVGF